MAFAPTLDHVGIFAATSADINFACRSLGFDSHGEPASAVTVVDWPPRGSLESVMADAFRSAVEVLSEMGVTVESVKRPAFFDLLPDALHTVMAYECSREHGERYRQHGRNMGTKLAALLDEGLATSVDDYLSAITELESARTQFATWVADHPLVATPAALGPAPSGLGSSGDPRCNAPFTALGAPAISIPMPGASPPMGLQPRGKVQWRRDTPSECSGLRTPPCGCCEIDRYLVWRYRRTLLAISNGAARLFEDRGEARNCVPMHIPVDRDTSLAELVGGVHRGRDQKELFSGTSTLNGSATTSGPFWSKISALVLASRIPPQLWVSDLFRTLLQRMYVVQRPRPKPLRLPSVVGLVDSLEETVAGGIAR